jgi:hypothetical protein
MVAAFLALPTVICQLKGRKGVMGSVAAAPSRFIQIK